MDDRDLADFERDLRAFRPRAPGPLPARPRFPGTALAFFAGLAALIALSVSISFLGVWKTRVPRDIPVISQTPSVAPQAVPDVSLAALRRAARGDRELANALDAAAPRLQRAVGGEDARLR